MNSQLSNSQSSHTRRIAGLCRVISVTTLVLFSVCQLTGQSSNPGDPKRGAAPGASYSISDIENINLTNGNLSLSMPLAKLPGGRGGMGGWIGYTYNSKLYRPQVESVLVSNELVDRNILNKSDEGGWRATSSLDFRLKEIDRFGPPAQPITDCQGEMAQYAWKNAWRWKLQVTMPDGSDKDFRPIEFGDQGNDGFFELRSNGQKHVFNASNCSTTVVQHTTNPIVYYSGDGSALRLVVDPLTQAFTLYFPDGSFFQSATQTTLERLTDRNGNFVQRSAPFEYNGRPAGGIEDSVGRKIFGTAGDNPGETDFYQLGVNGAPIKWTAKTKNIYVRRTYQSTANDSVRGRGGSSTHTSEFEHSVLERITLPSQVGGQTFEFGYSGSNTPFGGSGFSDGWGELNFIKLPSGAEVNYEFLIPNENTDKILAKPVSKKTLTYLSQHEEFPSNHEIQEETTYAFNSLNGTTVVTAPDGSSTTHTYFSSPDQHPLNGFIRSIETPTGKSEKYWLPNPTPWGGFNYFVKAEFSSLKDASGSYLLTAVKDYTVDKNGNNTKTVEFDFLTYCAIPRSAGPCSGDPQPFPSPTPIPARMSETTYWNPVPTYLDPSIPTEANAYWNFGGVKGVVASSTVKDSNQQVKAHSEIEYDNVSTTANPRFTKAWDSTKSSSHTPLNSGNAVITEAQYDSYGNVTQTWDAKGNRTEITYGSISWPGGSVSGLYPTQTVTAANNTTIKRTSSATYDYYTGVVTQATDVDNNVSAVTTYDQVGRPLIVKNAYQTSVENWTQTIYDDLNRIVVVKGDLNTVGDGKLVSSKFYDQLGRVRLSKTLEDSVTQSATNETDGIKVRTRYKASNAGYSYQLTSNPYRANVPGNETDPTMGWTLSTISTTWSTGLKTEIETFSGAGLPQAFGGGNMASTGIVRTNIDANRTLVTDQAGRQRISKTNGLGQLTNVWEIKDWDSATVPVSFPGTSVSYGYQTNYLYDTLNNLTTVQQGAQTRSFAYSSLSRLTSATNPETGSNSVLYQYDNNGNLEVKTDTRGVSIHYIYDALNRITRRAYNSSTSPGSTVHNSPPLPSGVATTYEAKYLYDLGTNGKGRLTEAATGYQSGTKWKTVTSNSYMDYDAMGRPALFRQQIGELPIVYLDVLYQYNRAGSVTNLTYPSGNSASYTYDNAGRLSSFQGNLGDGISRTYADSFQYTPFGGIQQERFGTTTSLYHKQRFNARGQQWDARLSTQSFAANPGDGDRGAIVNYYGSNFTQGG